MSNLRAPSTAYRDQAIRDEIREGRSNAHLARAYGLSVATIQRIWGERQHDCA
jgi:hypothetical protein